MSAYLSSRVDYFSKRLTRMKMQVCLICNGAVPKTSFITDVFSEINVLPSNRCLIETLREIIDKPLEKESANTTLLCRQCTTSCIEYDEFKSKLNTIKTQMCDNYNKKIEAQLKKPYIAIEDRKISKVVVPASKLQPLPPDFQLNFQQFAAVSRANNNNVTPSTPQINLKVTIGSSVFTQSLSSSTVKISKPLEIEPNWTIENLPKEIFSNVDDEADNNDGPDNNDDADKDDDDDVMEIDEECTLVPSENQNEYETANIKIEVPQISEDGQYLNVNVLENAADGNFVLENLYSTDNEDGDAEPRTLIVDGKTTSILGMMAGQKLIYENGELLVMQDDGDGEENDEGHGDDESNDESQIELQVSGDEETANAIIAAAQEKGGAFIKVESGEMYRVKSVHSAAPAAIVAIEGNKFRCLLCQNEGKTDEDPEKNLLYAALMMRHLKEEHDVKLYICQMCGIGIRKRQEYTKHIASHSVRSQDSSCNSSRTLLHDHNKGQRPYRCERCNKGFVSKYTLQAHLKTHQNRPRPFKCKQCNKAFLSIQNLTQHEKTHLGIKNFVCNVCNKSFVTQHNLEVHGVVHSGARPHHCTTCEKSFARRAELVDHIRTHTGERPFSCNECGARFAQRSNLHSHTRATHRDDKRHHCTHCPKRFKRRRLLEYHIKASHTGERPLKCETCGATFVYPEHYKKHIRIHSGERPFYCEICGKSFNSRDNRNMHRFTHSDKKPYECLACGHSYMRKRLLIAHMNASGHLAESIVVNQPRVTRVRDENGLTTIVQLDQSDQQVLVSKLLDSEQNNENVANTTDKLQLLADENIKSEETEKTREDNVQLFTNTEDPLNLDNTEANLLEDVNSTQLETTAQIGNEVLRLIQVKLPDGNNGWVAFN